MCVFIWQGEIQQLLIVDNPRAAGEYCHHYIPDCDFPLPYRTQNYEPEEVSTHRHKPPPVAVFHSSCFIIWLMHFSTSKHAPVLYLNWIFKLNGNLSYLEIDLVISLTSICFPHTSFCRIFTTLSQSQLFGFWQAIFDLLPYILSNKSVLFSVNSQPRPNLSSKVQEDVSSLEAGKKKFVACMPFIST